MSADIIIKSECRKCQRDSLFLPVRPCTISISLKQYQILSRGTYVPTYLNKEELLVDLS